MQSNYGGVLGSNKARGKFEIIPKPKESQESSRNKRNIRNWIEKGLGNCAKFFCFKISKKYLKLIRNKNYTSACVCKTYATQSRTQCDNNKKICMKHKNNSQANWKQQKKQRKKNEENKKWFFVFFSACCLGPLSALCRSRSRSRRRCLCLVPLLSRSLLVAKRWPRALCVCMSVLVWVCVSCERARKGNLTQFYRRAMFITFPFLCVCFILCFIRCFVSFPLLINVCFASSTFRLDQHIDTAHARRCRCGQEGRQQQQQHSQIQHSQRRSWQRSQQPEQY